MTAPHRPPGKPQSRAGHGGQGTLHRILPETQARTGAQRSRTMRDRCPQPPRVSTRAVNNFDNNAIGAALRKLLDRDALNPPTLPEFLRLCGRRNGTLTEAHRLLPPSPKNGKETHSPSDRCATLAAHLDEESRPIINERLNVAIPANYRAVVSRYWLSRLATLGPLGQSITRTTPPKETTA